MMEVVYDFCMMQAVRATKVAPYKVVPRESAFLMYSSVHLADNKKCLHKSWLTIP